MSARNNSPLEKLNDYKKENYVCQRIQLTSPLLHIGVGEAGSLNLFEYIQENKSIYFPNQTALAEALQNTKSYQQNKALRRFTKQQSYRSGLLEQYENLSQQYISIIESKANQREKDRQIANILDGLKKLYQEALGSEWLRDQNIFPKTGISANLSNRLLTKDIAPMIRNGFGEIYIPGSSIKGAIRTAIAYYLLKHQAPTKVSDIEQKLRQAIHPKMADNKKKFLDDNLFLESTISLNSYLFSNFTLRSQERAFGKSKINKANTDLMRAIKVSDSDPINIDRKQKINLPIVAEVLTSSFQASNGERIVADRARNYLEMISNLNTQLYICIDTTMLDWFHREQGVEIPAQLKKVQGILDICDEFAQAQWEHEQNYWNKITNSPSLNFSSIHQFYNSPCSHNLRLGWGSGMTGTTVGLLFQEQTRASIRDACGKPTNSSEAPKSRRTATIPEQGNSIRKPLGWVKLEPL
jgi:CRISPR-associated protein Csm5